MILGSLLTSGDVRSTVAIFAGYENLLADGVTDGSRPGFYLATSGYRASKAVAKKDRECPVRRLLEHLRGA
jgi:hypothetical protein